MKQVPEIIKESGLTQNELAEKMNLSKQYVSHLVHNRKNTSMEFYAKLCEACGFEISVKKLKKSSPNT